MNSSKNSIFNGVMFNAYPDSIGTKLSDTVEMLKRKEFENVFSLFYILPTFFNSDLDRGFSIIDYNINKELVSEADLKALAELEIQLKFDIVLNHLSVASPQFKDLLRHGERSKYKDFFINWNTFWKENGTLNQDGIIVPKDEFLEKLFMRKAGLPVLKVRFPDGSEQAYWNTFYQKIDYAPLQAEQLAHLEDISSHQAELICQKLNSYLENSQNLSDIDFSGFEVYQASILKIIENNKRYLGQMDVNANSPLVWDFYEETLAKVKSFGGQILRLDAFAYLHKQIGQSNFFNTPGTWNYLERIKQIAEKNNLTLLPEIHAEYGLGLHEEVAEKGYHIYDFFLPGLMLHTIENANNQALLSWAKEIVSKGYKTINMLGCHDGIPVLDLKGKEVNGSYNKGLLNDTEIEAIMSTILNRGGRVKNLYDPEGNKISYYQVNATFFSALGENEQKLVLARAIQLFMPGIPQIWYLDLFAGTNDFEAADKIGSGGHKEINRTTLSIPEIEEGLRKNVVQRQLEIMHLRNTSNAFSGAMTINESAHDEIDIIWRNENETAHLKANLKTYKFIISHTIQNQTEEFTF
jgi:sucrose phosphorylase